MNTDRDKLFNKVLVNLGEVALKDGIVTPDEEAILQTVNIGIDEYFQYLDQAMEDDVIDFNEYTTLNGIAAKIVHQSEKTALLDGIVTHDEKQLIHKLTQLLKEYTEKQPKK
ncbi:MAG: hypothetical protein INQ03_23310 [Candidatus Heimdallarchaeota archaeon]|nr:hypothetical protein [Candidatus Heimdallarchaeota archaeon]